MEEPRDSETESAFHIIDDLEDPDQYEDQAIAELAVKTSYAISLLRRTLKQISTTMTGKTLADVAAESLEPFQTAVAKAIDRWNTIAVDKWYPIADGHAYLNPANQQNTGSCWTDLALQVLNWVAFEACAMDAVAARERLRAGMVSYESIDDCLVSLESRVRDECEAAYKIVTAAARPAPADPTNGNSKSTAAVNPQPLDGDIVDNRIWVCGESYKLTETLRNLLSLALKASKPTPWNDVCKQMGWKPLRATVDNRVSECNERVKREMAKAPSRVKLQIEDNHLTWTRIPQVAPTSTKSST